VWPELQVYDGRKLGEFLTYKKDRSGNNSMFVIDETGAVAVQPCRQAYNWHREGWNKAENGKNIPAVGPKSIEGTFIGPMVNCPSDLLAACKDPSGSTDLDFFVQFLNDFI